MFLGCFITFAVFYVSPLVPSECVHGMTAEKFGGFVNAFSKVWT